MTPQPAGNQRDSGGDPPPFAWLDDPAQPFGPVSVPLTIAVGVGLLAVGGFAVLLGVIEDSGARAARIATGLPLGLIGAVILGMGMARRSWRLRNPGRDPLAAAHQAGANVGSAFGNDSLAARLGRWLLVAVSGVVVLGCALALRNAVAGPESASTVQVVIIVALGLLAAWTGWRAITRSIHLRRARRAR